MRKQLYLQAFIKIMDKAIESGNYTHDDIKKLVLYGVKYANTQHSNDMTTFEKAEGFYKFVVAISDFMGYLTPNEFMNMFPIIKEYRGHKWGMKDYFYTMKYINTLERDKPIKDQNIDDGSVIGFLWEYHNWEIRRFTVNLTTSLSNLQRFQGIPTITDSLFDTFDIKPLNIHKSNGRQFLLDSSGKTKALHKPLPRYLKQIK